MPQSWGFHGVTVLSNQARVQLVGQACGRPTCLQSPQVGEALGQGGAPAGATGEAEGAVMPVFPGTGHTVPKGLRIKTPNRDVECWAVSRQNGIRVKY